MEGVAGFAFGLEGVAAGVVLAGDVEDTGLTVTGEEAAGDVVVAGEVVLAGETAAGEVVVAGVGLLTVGDHLLVGEVLPVQPSGDCE